MWGIEFEYCDFMDIQNVNDNYKILYYGTRIIFKIKEYEINLTNFSMPNTSFLF